MEATIRTLVRQQNTNTFNHTLLIDTLTSTLPWHTQQFTTSTQGSRSSIRHNNSHVLGSERPSGSYGVSIVSIKITGWVLFNL